jgi:hypothetical protein
MKGVYMQLMKGSERRGRRIGECLNLRIQESRSVDMINLAMWKRVVGGMEEMGSCGKMEVNIYGTRLARVAAQPRDLHSRLLRTL